MLNKRILVPTLFIVVLSFSGLAYSENIYVGHFSQNDLEGWETESFAGETDYAITEEDGRTSLQANSEQTASALYKEVEINIKQTPYLNWSWQINKGLPELNEQTKQGDDYAARIYVVVKTGIFPWNTYALNYVWSSKPEKERVWPNAFTGNAIMISKRSNHDPVNAWVSEKVNVYEDMKQPEKAAYYRKLRENS